MTWCNDCNDEPAAIVRRSSSQQPSSTHNNKTINCPSCGHQIKYRQEKKGIHDLPGLPAGVKFDPSDQELLEHLEAKAWPPPPSSDIEINDDEAPRANDKNKTLHPLIDEFIPTLEGDDGICYTHPERLPGVSRDGVVRHFFHRPSKAYTTGTRKRRKVHTDIDGNETRWHKTGKTRPVVVDGKVKGHKKILVLYTNYGKQRKPGKTSWVMHQYHLGNNEDEKDGELVVSKVFYQTQPRQCGGSSDLDRKEGQPSHGKSKERRTVTYYNPSLVSFDQRDRTNIEANQRPVIINFGVHQGS